MTLHFVIDLRTGAGLSTNGRHVVMSSCQTDAFVVNGRGRLRARRLRAAQA